MNKKYKQKSDHQIIGSEVFKQIFREVWILFVDIHIGLEENKNLAKI